MVPTSQRVKSIYSAIASPNRLEILRILNAKGSLSYSDLKTLAGFRSKKESGKFAYHLRKLVRQALVSLNRTERKYAISSLGRLVLNLTRQIEEQSMLNSGKFYVRTSRQTMEEFNPDKILRSLIREAGMPVELAHRIANEVEARLTKFQTVYLTAPLIREMVNALLIERGYEEYRHKLTRLGLPTFDVMTLITEASKTKEGISAIIGKTAKVVFTEYLLLTQLPRDISDAYLSGDIHLSNIGCWGLMPDTLFIDLTSLYYNDIHLGGGLISTPRFGPPNDMEEVIVELTVLTSLLSLETTSEIVYENFLAYIGRYAKGKSHKELKGAILRAFLSISSILTNSYNKPNVSIQINPHSLGNFKVESINKTMLAVLEAYKDYANNTLQPQIKLILFLDRSEDIELIKHVASILDSGGCVSISTQPDSIQAYSGLKKSFPSTERKLDGFSAIHSLSLNLPRLSYESNRDEAYFRAKLAMLLQLAISALSTRRKIVGETISKGLLPTLAQNPSIISVDYMPAVINLVGLDEALLNLIDEETAQLNKRTITEKIVKTAIKFTNENVRQIEKNIRIGILQSDGAERFYALDVEKYGKSIVISKVEKNAYSQTPYIQEVDLYNADLVDELNYLSRNLEGGFSIVINIPSKAKEDVVKKTILKAIEELDYFKLNKRMIMCKNCGAKYPMDIKRCKVCGHTILTHYSTA
ncbi:MAG: helix-turn-helix domain-containing protein [Candidatus Methylarchaceae archaeon HK01B]|nr:helix-turn-helix domain-containing protein [Candidatus Methylarchaceae archaeon HK01B]